MGLGELRVSQGIKVDVPDPVTVTGNWPTAEEREAVREEEEAHAERRSCCCFFTYAVPKEDEGGRTPGSVEATTCRRALWLTFLRMPVVLFCCF